MKWLVKKFDYDLKKVVGYWDLTEIDYFVDSDLGDDSNSGTYDPITGIVSPFKTLAKVKSLGAGIWVAGITVMVNGIFDEVFSINVAARFIGAGGGLGGRAIFKQYVTNTVNNVIVDTVNWFHHGVFHLYMYNCLIPNITVTFNYGINYYLYYCCFHKTTFTGGYATSFLQGNNNTYQDCIVLVAGSGPMAKYNIYGNNNHSNKNAPMLNSNLGFNNIWNSNGQYLDPDNLNFNFLNTSPLFRTGTFNPEAQNYNHVGAGTEGMNHNALSPELDNAGNATYTNLTKDGSTIYRPDIDINGILETGIIDMGEMRYRVTIDLNNTYETASGKFYRKIQWSETLTQREGFDYILQIGSSEAEVATCPEMLMEFGKEVSYSGSGASMKGNADPDFDPDNEEIGLFRYYKLKAKFRTITV